MSETRAHVNHNPQAEQMGDESMVRALDAQARAIWPQESELFARYALTSGARILDLGCGTGQISRRIAELLPQVEVLGIDIHEPHLELARKSCTDLGTRVRFEVGDAYKLPLESNSVDLGVCRHLLQAVPDASQVLRELARVVRPGGSVHLLCEDYGQIHLHPTRLDCDVFWRDLVIAFGKSQGTDMKIGRRMLSLLQEAGFHDVGVDYLTIDNLRVEPQVLVEIWEAWRDGFSSGLAQLGTHTPEQIAAYFEDMIECLLKPGGYGIWQMPIWYAKR